MAWYDCIKNNKFNDVLHISGEVYEFDDAVSPPASGFAIIDTPESRYKCPAELTGWYDITGKIHIESPTILPSLETGSVALEYIDFDLDPNCDIQEGRRCWNSEEGTMSTGMPGGNVTLNDGMELFIPRQVRNDTASDMLNGQFVYISGGTGNNVAMGLANASSKDTAESTIAALTEDIDKNSRGYATIAGLVRGDENQPIDTSAYAVGTILYLSATTPGAFTDTLPAHPNYVVKLGQVFRQHATVGAIIVNIEEPVCACKIAGGEDAVYKDENFSSTSTAVGAAAPDFIDLDTTSIKVAALNGLSTAEELSSTIELQHDYYEGSDLKPHAHIGATTSGSGDIKLNLDYYVRSGSTLLASGTLSAVVSVNNEAWEDKIILFDDIDGSTFSIQPQISFRLWRDPGDVADTYASDVYIKTWGYHYRVDSLGSRNIGTKG